jgi:hypothetical protein
MTRGRTSGGEHWKLSTGGPHRGYGSIVRLYRCRSEVRCSSSCGGMWLVVNRMKNHPLLLEHSQGPLRAGKRMALTFLSLRLLW